MQNWRFVLVKDPEKKKQIRAASWDQSQVTDCSLLVLCADFMEENPSQYYKEFLVNAMGPFYEGDELQRDEAMRSCGIAAQTMMLTAKAMGSSNPMIGQS